MIDPLKLQKLPRWAQDVVRSGCFEGNASQAACDALHSAITYVHSCCCLCSSVSTRIGHHDMKSVFRHSPKHQSPSSNGKQKRVQGCDDELIPTKRHRSLKRESREGVTDGDDDGDDDYDDEMPLSQASLDGDECPPRTLFTREEQVAGSIEKFSDQIVQLLNQLQDRQQSGSFQRNGTDLITHVEVRALLQTLKIMHKRSMIGKVDPDILMMLMGALDKEVRPHLCLS